MALSHLARRICWAAGCGLLAGCLVPIPLDQQNTSDGGQLLLVRQAEPAFGIRRAIRQIDPLTLSIEVESDAETLYARLYWQINGTCCELTPKDPLSTHFLNEVQGIRLSAGVFRVEWKGVLPCYQPVPPMATAYLVPVLATGPFIQGPTEGFDAQGATDRNHFWGIICPS